MSANRQWKVVDERYSGNVFTDDHWYSTHILRIVRVRTTQTTQKIRKTVQYCANFYAKPSFELLKTWNHVKHRYGEHRRTTAEVPRQKNWWNAQIADVSRKTQNLCVIHAFMRILGSVTGPLWEMVFENLCKLSAILFMSRCVKYTYTVLNIRLLQWYQWLSVRLRHLCCWCTEDTTFENVVCKMPAFLSWGRFLSLAWSRLRLCSANHTPGYWSNLTCDWRSTAWAKGGSNDILLNQIPKLKCFSSRLAVVFTQSIKPCFTSRMKM